MSDKFFDKRSGRTLTIRPEAWVLSPVFEEEYFLSLKKYLENAREQSYNFNYDTGFGRVTHHSNGSDKSEIFFDSHQKLVPVAREIFNNPNIEASYCIYSVYKGYRACLDSHIDDNACTYTIDLCVSYDDPWPIFIEGKQIDVNPNEAIVYYGEDQYHWRPKFPNPKTNEVAMIFYHFVDKSHWFFTEGPQYVGKMISDREKYQRSAKL